MSKLWHEAPSANFRVRPVKDMLLGGGISRVFQSVPNRTTIPKALRPQECYKFDESYVKAYIAYVFDGIGATVDDCSLSASLAYLVKSDRIVKLNVAISPIDTGDYVDDYSTEYLISELIVKFLAITDNPDSPRNKKAVELALAIKNLLDTTTYNDCEANYHRKRLSI